jgi:CubicO group peptidase (beta-lactamase class C family)
MQLMERGKFLLSDPLYEYIPEFKEMYIKNKDGSVVKAKNPITVGNLFTMTAGFVYNFDTEGFRRARELTGGKMDTVTTIKCAAADPLTYDPGTHWGYSIGHDVLGALVSVISGQKFRDYVKQNIFDPLDMKEAVYHHTEETLKRMPTQYYFVPDGSEEGDIVEAQKHGKGNNGVFKDVGKDVSHILGEEFDSGGAGIITTVADYAKLMAALANYGTGLTGERILSKYSVDLMRTNRLNKEQLADFAQWPHMIGSGYGLGVRTHMDPARSDAIANVGEFGWGGAAGATAFADPSINLGVFYAQHVLNPREGYYQPRLRNIVYSCL